MQTDTTTTGGSLVTALRGNLLLSTVSGVVAVIGAWWLDRVLGVPSLLLVALGVGLLGFAGGIGLVLRRPQRLARDARAVIAADTAWVVAAVPVVALDLLTPTGDVVLGTLTVLVAAVTLAQVRGLAQQ